MYVFTHEKSQSRWIVAGKGLQAYSEPDGEALGELPNWSMALGKTFLYEVERSDGWMKYELMPHCKAKMDETLHTGWVPMSMNGEATLETWAKQGWDRNCYVHGDKKGYNQLYLEKEDGQTEDELFDSLQGFRWSQLPHDSWDRQGGEKCTKRLVTDAQLLFVACSQSRRLQDDLFEESACS